MPIGTLGGGKKAPNEPPSILRFGHAGSVGLDVDGYWGSTTILALQRALGTPVDGVVSEGSAMVMALQQRLNEGRL